MNTPGINDELKARVLNRIECDAICPRPRLIFKGRECVLWCLWVATVAIGALAVAVSFFVILQQTYSLYEVTHGSFWGFFIETLPILWFSVFLGMVIFAVYNLRHTKNGYRYPLWQIFGSSLILSLAGGALLHLAGTGFILDRQMGLMTGYYESQEKREQKIWQQPEQGRLLGYLHSPDMDEDESSVDFVDQQAVLWLVDISELDSDEKLLLKSGVKVRLLGEVIRISPPHFHACAALPWLHETMVTRLQLNNIRQRMISKSSRYKESVTKEPFSDSPCVRRLGELRFEFGR